MTGLDIGWFLYWLIGFGAIAFGVAEFIAIRYAKARATLSYQINYVASRFPAGYWILGFLMAWLWWHFTFGSGHRWIPWRK